jgi:exopolyphosphatase/guanosine-5'-triphosphate,3'-diphosphate pyrophosphatase
MLMVKQVAGSVQVIARIKRKVRLASGLDEDFFLNQVAMARGWECLALFAERLQDIPRENIHIVATATLRLATNAADFVKHAQTILNHQINIISGEEEARMIYLGVAQTSNCDSNRLVIDIGGASTEVIIGNGFKPLELNSLNIGCVTFLERYFADNLINTANFEGAIDGACKVLESIKDDYFNIGWQSAVGASGTVQAIQEILVSQGHAEELTLERLESIKEQAIACGTLDKLDIEGLVPERRLVFVSGLSILMGIFKTLKVERMTLAGGALREGVLYGLLMNMQHTDIRSRTLNSLLIRHHIDDKHAVIVAEVAANCAKKLKDSWNLDEFEGLDILNSAALLHELGLIVDYRKYHHHGAYILNQTELPGFSRAQKKLLTALVSNHREGIDQTLIGKQTMTSCQLAQRLTRILRVAVILSMRRLDDALPAVSVASNGDELSITLPKGWLEAHPLMRTELELEIEEQGKAGWTLIVG